TSVVLDRSVFARKNDRTASGVIVAHCAKAFTEVGHVEAVVLPNNGRGDRTDLSPRDDGQGQARTDSARYVGSQRAGRKVGSGCPREGSAPKPQSPASGCKCSSFGVIRSQRCFLPGTFQRRRFSHSGRGRCYLSHGR